ncbi:6259_t:CDS:1 [Dentiscutata heterogama]|uniref:6259_t:CDS:1 n=1 Tax=Dentiscutata heterogama TaxID=1316150 RepID=A0ACA9MRZ0_9GLOM|nr:6259_t:CDS:1 [Dentiscutata heterogama]
MSQLRAAMNYRNNLKAIENSIKKYQENFLPLLESNNPETSTQTNQDYIIIVSDFEDEEEIQISELERNNNPMNEKEWNKMVLKWIDMINDNKHAQSEEE